MASGGNTLHSLSIEKFPIGVRLGVFTSHITITDTVISNLNLAEIARKGIHLQTTLNPEQATYNRWVNTWFIGNTIEAKRGGINVAVVGLGDGADTADDLIIAENSIRLTGESGLDLFGINLSAGNFLLSRQTKLKDIVIAYNALEGNLQAGFRVTAGASGNTVDGVRIFGNQVRLQPGREEFGGKRDGLQILTGDGATDDVNPRRRGTDALRAINCRARVLTRRGIASTILVSSVSC